MLTGVLCVFTATEVNYARLSPQSQLAIFALLGLVLCFLQVPARPAWVHAAPARLADRVLALVAAFCCGYIVWQTEPAFAGSWIDGRSLGNRAGYERPIDVAVGIAGLLVILEATRRSIGLALPILAGLFLAYAAWGPFLPDWLFPHRGYGLDRIVAQTFLHTQGVFGVALSVMFTYVFLFVLFGAFLQATGATKFIIDFAHAVFRGSPGGSAKVAVLSSGLMGSLSGSAVANTATTGTFTIPMMRSAGFRRETAAGIEAAASSGGALVPPVMGAGAYMMLEIVQPPVTYLQIIQAAILPALLYYLSLTLIVHFHAMRLSIQGQTTGAVTTPEAAATTLPPEIRPTGRLLPYEGVIFIIALATLLLLLIAGHTAFRAVSLSLVAVAAASLFNRRTRLTPASVLAAVTRTARDVVPLVCASACVGIVIGVVTLTGVGSRLPAAILPLAEESLLLALMLIMVSAIVLGMGLPSAVTYLLLATLIGPALGQLGVVPLAAHLFIFYFGMMSMVTPPVALAAYAAGSIAGADIMRTGLAAFRFALVGFTLPYMFVFRPELLLLDHAGGPAAFTSVIGALTIATLGIIAFAAGIGGYLRRPTTTIERGLLFGAAALLLAPGPSVAVAGWPIPVLDAGGLMLLASVGAAHLVRTGAFQGSPAAR